MQVGTVRNMQCDQWSNGDQEAIVDEELVISLPILLKTFLGYKMENVFPVSMNFLSAMYYNSRF